MLGNLRFKGLTVFYIKVKMFASTNNKRLLIFSNKFSKGLYKSGCD